ncbi:hypothetical protein predicted by Glimmer/Critica [Acetobacter senegalensis]|uniref:Uncharacterized protein n=1 Tax=Acetobacter senegalensis TaxID=446692 RepID=A0A0U5FKM8_9PROT|nr:hypothetical protein predicted by Glimmer/Critica [Acetobacter senegalensis]
MPCSDCTVLFETSAGKGRKIYARQKKVALTAQYAANRGNSPQRTIKNYLINLTDFSNSFPLTS